jgi:hypothetical protein
MQVSIISLRRVALPSIAAAAGIAAIALGAHSPAPAQAAEVCPDGRLTSTAPTADAQIFEVEGKISRYDATARTITANGMTFKVPDTLKIKTQDLDQAVGNIEFTGPGSLTDPALEAQLPITGGTAIAAGDAVVTPVAETGQFCVIFQATSVYVEPAEHGIVGPLLGVDKANGTFTVGGSTVKMSTDPRFPSQLIDLAGTQLTLDQLESQVGNLLDVVGYYDEAAGTLRGTVVEADVITPQATTDTVALSRAQWKSPELRVRGTVSRLPNGLFADSVDLHTGTSDGTNCTGPRLATVGIDPAGDGSFEFRLRNVNTNPQNVCVKSLGGGVDDIAVTLG